MAESFFTSMSLSSGGRRSEPKMERDVEMVMDLLDDYEEDKMTMR